ncbi:unnamed protein product [Adineta ricciae]|uniref:alpha-galactosidase n=1 Tax=Adineta ricciae TaxID=249248 RepID=A0A815RF02_ADIRI|nr:unnamed protein product [Adineta ricciae]CAF1476234.1 unnamed protein product [Adineta ricciae]
MGANLHIPIETECTALVIRVNQQCDFSTVYIGKRLANPKDYELIPSFEAKQFNGDYTGLYSSAYTPNGTRNLLEPALQVIHADQNPSLDLKYVSHQQKSLDQSNEVILTKIYLKDPVYPFEVILHYRAYYKENIIEQWSSIQHNETDSVRLQKYSSANLYFSTFHQYYLTHFHGAWAREMIPEEIQLTAGIKVLDTKLGTRADLFQAPSFLLSFNQPINYENEDSGEVFAGTLAWTGNYKIEFEIDSMRNLRLIAGINPYASEYFLIPNKEFVTPSFLFTYSSQGLSTISHRWHQWARKYRVPDGQGNRLTLLNNWESTYFDFDEAKLTSLIQDARQLGVDLFLLDDGWFGNKYPRDNDSAGLGDWQVNRRKLPNGIGYLISQAQANNIQFGIWIEPEMVNPRSELYENHPDWVIKLPNRSEYYFRNQLVLDMSNPQVQEFVFDIVDRLFTDHPQLAYIKWDCNAVIYNAYSPTNLHQSHLYVDYVRGLYDILDRLRKKYPSVPIMLCSGGGGRVDYGILQYFTEFWPSDNTDGLERVFIQWNYSFFFPTITLCNHVTNWGKQSLKFRTDVAMMGKLGYDLVVSKLNENELKFSQQVLHDYARLKSIIWHGRLFRLVSPYRLNRDIASLIYVNAEQDQAVWFTYLVGNRYLAGSNGVIRLKGLNPLTMYKIQEINIYPGTDQSTIVSVQSISGDYLMTYGFDPVVDVQRASVVLQLTNVMN